MTADQSSQPSQPPQPKARAASLNLQSSVADGLKPPALTRDDYTSFRAQMVKFGTSVLNGVQTTTTVEAGKALGLIRHGKTARLNENLATAISDYILFDWISGGTTAVQRALRHATPTDDGLTQELYEGLRASYLSMFGLVKALDDQSAHLFDIFAQRDVVLADLTLGQTPLPPNVLFTARLIPFRDACITSGSVLAFPVSGIEILQTRLIAGGFTDAAVGRRQPMNRQRQTEFNTILLRAGLEAGGATRVAYRSVAAK